MPSLKALSQASVVLVVLILVLGMIPSATLADTQTPSPVETEQTGPTTSSESTLGINMTYHVRLDEANDSIRVRLNISLNRTDTIYVFPPRENVTITEVTGVTEDDVEGTRYSGENVDQAVFEYWVPLNASITDFDSPVGGDEWVLFKNRDVVNFGVGRSGDKVVTTHVSGPETTVSGGILTYIGPDVPSETIETDGGRQIEIVRTPNADASLTDLAELYDSADHYIDTGYREANVTVFVVPDSEYDVGTAYRSTPDTDVVISDETTEVTHLHELVHTRQPGLYIGDRNMVWLTEAMAEYLGYYGALQSDPVDQVYLGRILDVSADGGGQLGNPNDWQSSSTPYDQGASVLAALDLRIRRATNDNATIFDVFYQITQSDEHITLDRFKTIVEEVSGTSMDSWIDRMVTTDAEPTLPDREEYVDRTEHAPDDDGVPFAQERALGTNPYAASSDSDPYPDGYELRINTSPTEETPPSAIVDYYAADDGTITTTDLAEAIEDWAEGNLDTIALQAIVSRWARTS